MKNTLNNAINTQVNHHSSSEFGWKYQPLAAELSWFTELFQIAFLPENPAPMITIDPDSTRTLGSFRLGYNGAGILDHININAIYAVSRPLFDTLSTLLHEMVHSWEYTVLPEDKRTNSWYHKKAFCEKMAYLGILTSEKGVTLEIDPKGRFAHLLKQHGIEPGDMRSYTSSSGQKAILVPPKKKKGKSSLRKWSCGCTNVRIGKSTFNATCDDCGNKFQPVD